MTLSLSCFSVGFLTEQHSSLLCKEKLCDCHFVSLNKPVFKQLFTQSPLASVFPPHQKCSGVTAVDQQSWRDLRLLTLTLKFPRRLSDPGRFVLSCTRSVCGSSTCLCCASCGLSARPSRSTRAPRCCLTPPSPLIMDTLRRRMKQRRMKQKRKRRRRRSRALSHSLLPPLHLCLCLHPAVTPGTSGSRTPFRFPNKDARRLTHVSLYLTLSTFFWHLCQTTMTFSVFTAAGGVWHHTRGLCVVTYLCACCVWLHCILTSGLIFSFSRLIRRRSLKCFKTLDSLRQIVVFTLCCSTCCCFVTIGLSCEVSGLSVQTGSKTESDKAKLLSVMLKIKRVKCFEAPPHSLSNESRSIALISGCCLSD